MKGTKGARQASPPSSCSLRASEAFGRPVYLLPFQRWTSGNRKHNSLRGMNRSNLRPDRASTDSNHPCELRHLFGKTNCWSMAGNDTAMLRTGQQGAKRNQWNDRGPDDPIDIVEREHCGLRLDEPVRMYPKLLMSAREPWQILKRGRTGQMRSNCLQAPGLEDREMLDQARLMDLLAAEQRIRHQSDADCGAGLAQHVDATGGVADPVRRLRRIAPPPRYWETADGVQGTSQCQSKSRSRR